MMDENLFLGDNMLNINCLNPVLWCPKNVRLMCTKIKVFFRMTKCLIKKIS